MTTALDIITDALLKLGVYAPGETPTDADVEAGFSRLNDMLDMWAAEHLTVYQITSISFPVVAGKTAYTIGLIGEAGADIPAARPARVSTGPGAASLAIGTSTYPLRVVTAATWRTAMLSANNISGIPDTLWYDPQYPLAAVNLLPNPNAAGTATFSAWTPLPSFAALATAYTLAPGVAEALKNNLAVALKSYFNDMTVQPPVVAAAGAAKAALGQFGMPSRSYMPSLGGQNAGRR